jgi:hypothetical protein
VDFLLGARLPVRNHPEDSVLMFTDTSTIAVILPILQCLVSTAILSLYLVIVTIIVRDTAARDH